MQKALISVALAASIAMPAAAFAQTTAAPMRATASSAPARAAVTASSAAPTRVEAPSSEPQEASTDYLLKLGGVEGESTKGATPGVEPDEIDVMVSDEETRGGNVEYEWKVEEGEKMEGVEPDEIDAAMEQAAEGQTASTESTRGTKKGNVEYEWKVEEGESAPPANTGFDRVDAPSDPQPITPDFSILLGGGGGGGSDDDEGDELTEETRSAVADILLKGMQEEGAPSETLSLNFEKIKTTAKQSVKLFGFIPLSITATVEIDADGNAEVSYPWWSFLVGGKDGDSLGKSIVASLSNVLKTKHDTIKNAIGNIR